MLTPRLPVAFAIALFAVSVTAAPLFRQPLPVDLNWVWAGTPGPLVAADFNGDTFPDLAYPHNDGRLMIGLSVTGGPFAAPLVTTVPTHVTAMVAGDLNNDGKNDLVFRRGLELGVLLGNGDGTFTAGPAAPTTSFGPIAVGDLNGDGKLDVVAAVGSFVTGGPSTAEISIHLGNGDGVLGSGVKTSLVGHGPGSDLVVSDLNGDGRDDVIVNGSNVLAFLTAPNGTTLQQSWSYSAGRFAAGRLNADNHLDLIIRSQFGPGVLTVLLGQGNGTFAVNGTELAEPGVPFACSDIDSDGAQDIVTVSSDGIAVLRGLGNGTFADPLITAADGSGQFVLGDFDRDGERDIVTMSSFIASMNFVHGNGDGTFLEDRAYRAGVADGGQVYGISSLDMNGDTKPDATTLLQNPDGTKTISVLPNDGSGGLLSPVLTPTAMTGSMKAFLVGTLDGGTSPDAVVIVTHEGGISATSFLGNGSGGFTSSATMAVTTSPFPRFSASLADVTGDNVADLLVNGDLYEGNGDGTFDAAEATGVMFTVTGDVDGNGTIDAIWRDDGEDQIAIALNTGGGNFAAPVYFGSDLDYPAVLGDFDGDDIVDLFCGTSTGTSVFPGNGDGTFGNAIRMVIPNVSSTSPQVEDFDDDGELDVLLGVDLLLGNGDGRFRALEAGGFPSSTPAVADFNGDGQLDVISRGTRTVVVHLLGLVPEPTRTSTTTFNLPADIPRHATPMTYAATVEGNATPVTGAVLFKIASVPVGLAKLSLTMSDLPVTAAAVAISQTLALGTYPMNATFLGSATFLPSSGSRSITVERATTSLASRGPTYGEYGTTFDLGWTLTAPSVEGMAQPTNLYTLKENGVTVPNVQWLGDHALIKGLTAGVHTLTLAFVGDPNFKPSSVNIDVNIAKRSPQLVFDPLPAGTARLAGPVTLVARFNPGDYGAFTGTVAFSIDGSAVGTLAVNAGRAEQGVTLAAGRYSIGIEYSGDANNEPDSSVWVMYVYAPAGTLPAVTAEVIGGQTRLRWIPSADAASYVVYQRTLFATGWTVVRNAFVPETTVIMPSEKTWMFAVAPRYFDSTVGPKGPPDIATGVSFTDNPVVPGTPIRVSHVLQLRTAVNAVRTFAGLSAFSFTDATLTSGASIRAVYLTELRDALTAARNAIGMPIAFSPEPPAVGGVVKATHVEELRAGVR